MVPMRIGKIVLWTLIIFLCFRGIGSVIKGSNRIDVGKEVNEFYAAKEAKNTFSLEASAFAESFSLEYMTFKMDSIEDYKKRLLAYMPQSLISICDLTSSSDVQAVNAITLGKKFYTDNQIDINIKVKIKIINNKRQEILKDIFIAVPVSIKDGKYFVEELPMITATPESVIDVDTKSINKEMADEEVSKDINDMIQNFFKVYCEGNSNEISYYMYNSSIQINGLNGMLKFKSVEDVKIYKDNANSNIVTLTVMLLDEDSDQTIKQRIHINTVKKDGRYYIRSFDTRIYNLK